MNTVAQIRVEGKDEEDALLYAKEVLLDCERRFNFFSPISENSRICQNIQVGKRYVISKDLYQMLSFAQRVKEESGGLFDIDFENNDIVRNIHLADNTVTFDSKKTRLNLGAIAKGFGADKAMGIIKGFDVERAMISLGGHVVCFSRGEPWIIGLQNPRKDFGSLLGTLRLSNGVLSTSAENYRGQHIKNPLKENWSGNCESISVYSTNGMEADAYSTTLFLMGEKERMELVQKHKFGVIIAYRDNVMVTTDLNTEFKLTEDNYKLKLIGQKGTA